MSQNNLMDPPDEPGADVSHKTLFMLERLDSLAHVVVAAFFLVLSTAVLIAGAVTFVNGIIATTNHGGDKVGDFIHNSLEVLSTLLFAVIILELLRTIIT